MEGESIATMPAAGSAIVMAEEDRLKKVLDLDGLVGDLRRLGGFIRVAYNGVGAAGPEFTDLQIKIQNLGYDVTKLCDKSLLTLGKYERASSSVLIDLQAAYEYLLENFEEMAIATLSAVSKVAGELEKAALELHNDFEKEGEKVKATLELTQTAKKEHGNGQRERIAKLDKDREESEKKRVEQQQLMEEAARLEQQAEERRHEMEKEEDEAIRRISSNGAMKTFINAITVKMGMGPVFVNEAPEKKADRWDSLRIEALGKEDEYYQRRIEALSKMAEFAASVKSCDTEKQTAEVAVNALHEAVGALKDLSTVMLQAAAFWKQMEQHCNSLAEPKMKEEIEDAIKLYKPARRRELWNSKGFQRKAWGVYGGWIALQSVCKEHVGDIIEVRRELYQNIQENPTYEESRRSFKALADKFHRDTHKEQEEMAKKRSQTQKEIKILLGVQMKT